MVEVDPKITAVQIAKNIQEYDRIRINAQVVENFLHMKQYKACVPRKKPFVSKKNIKLLLEYIKNYVNKEDLWNIVMIFTDENKFNIFG